jgi:hypothetical protein
VNQSFQSHTSTSFNELNDFANEPQNIILSTIDHIQFQILESRFIFKYILNNSTTAIDDPVYVKGTQREERRGNRCTANIKFIADSGALKFAIGKISTPCLPFSELKRGVWKHFILLL